MLRFAIIILGLTISFQATAETSLGLEAFKNGEYKIALSEFEAPATKGDATAQLYMGHLYRMGLGVTLDGQVQNCL